MGFRLGLEVYFGLSLLWSKHLLLFMHCVSPDLLNKSFCSQAQFMLE